MKRALVTGATGFVGANLTRRLVADGHEVHLLLRHDYRPWRLASILDQVRTHIADLESRESIESILMKVQPEWIFHLAAHGAYPTQTDREQILKTNVMGTVALVSAALNTGFGSFINTGSSSEYGFKDHAPSEREWLEPNSDYAVSKAAATLLCSSLGASTGANIRTLRLYSIYGPWEEPERLVPRLAASGLRGRLPDLVSPLTARDFVHVDDAVDAYLLAATQPGLEPGAVFNIASGVQTSLAEAVETVRETLNVSETPRWGSLPARVWDTTVWIGDSSKARAELGWVPRHTFRGGFLQFVAWLRADNERARPYS